MAASITQSTTLRVSFYRTSSSSSVPSSCSDLSHPYSVQNAGGELARRRLGGETRSVLDEGFIDDGAENVGLKREGETLKRLQVTDQTSRVSNALFFLLLALLLSAQNLSANLIEKACHIADDKDACVEALTSVPDSASATLPELAIIVLKLASEKAANITTHVNTLLSNASSLEPAFYQSIDECSVHFQDAVDTVDNSMAAVSVNAYDDVARFLIIAVTRGC